MRSNDFTLPSGETGWFYMGRLCVEGRGAFYKTLQEAQDDSLHGNGVGYWEETYLYEGHIWYQCGHTNVWD